MNPWKLPKDETPPATGSKVPVWIETETGRIIPGSCAESLCDAGEDATGYWYDADGGVISSPARWMVREETRR
jgi:hypothetical protein